MKRLTQKEAIRLHREMWDWVAKTGETKWNWSGLKDYPKLTLLCFLCEYDSTQENDYCCDTCLLVWPGGNGCMSPGSPYRILCDAEHTIEETKRLAAIIRDLPVTQEEGESHNV